MEDLINSQILDTPATEAEDTFADYMIKTLMQRNVENKVLRKYLCDVVPEPESDLKRLSPH